MRKERSSPDGCVSCVLERVFGDRPKNGSRFREGGSLFLDLEEENRIFLLLVSFEACLLGDHDNSVSRGEWLLVGFEEIRTGNTTLSESKRDDM